MNHDNLQSTPSANEPQTGGRSSPVLCSAESVESAQSLKIAIIENLELGQAMTPRLREGVEKSNATLLRAVAPQLLGHKRPPTPILTYLEDLVWTCHDLCH